MKRGRGTGHRPGGPDGACVVFDVDGTLVQSYGFDERCFVQAVRDVLGDLEFSTDWTSYDHVTDAGILHRILDDNGLGSDEGLFDEVRDAFGARVQAYLDDGGACEATPGARIAVTSLVSAGARVGIATGGWGRTARLKLSRAGIPVDGLPFVSCDDAVERVAIIRACLAKLGTRNEEATYVGDGPWDLRASEVLGCRFIGVGERLSGRCPAWMPDLRGIQALL